MIGRGIDQILPHPGSPTLSEPYIKDAAEYVRLAEAVNGSIQKPVSFSYIWGDALEEFARKRPDVKIINLETCITKNDEPWPDKEIRYRMSPENTPCLAVAGVNCCALANNHILDWGYRGMIETLETLDKAGIKHVGAGKDVAEAEAPATLKLTRKSDVVVFAFGLQSSGIPQSWAATANTPGVNLLKDISSMQVGRIKAKIARFKAPKTVVVASIHWGANWGYEVHAEERIFAHQLIREAGVDIVHGHSSHHVKGIEVYGDKLILYGCGDFLNDYEGIRGYESFRSDLGLMYFSDIDSSTGKLKALEMVPTQVKRFRINLAPQKNAKWLAQTLNRECQKFKTRIVLTEDNRLRLLWRGD